FVAIREGEVAIVDAAGNELVRHGPSGFLGELNLLSGQTVFLNALVTEPLRYIAVERAALQGVAGVGLEIVGPRGSEPTMRLLEFARANRLPYSWQEAVPAGGGVLP